MNIGRPPLNQHELPPFHSSNLKVITRIRPPKVSDQSRDQKKTASSFINSPSNKNYISVRNKSRSTSKETQSPFSNTSHLPLIGNSAALRQTVRNSSGKRSNSRSFSRGNSAHKNSSYVASGSGLVNQEKKYCIFTTKERSNVVLACEQPVPGKLINEQLQDQQDLKYFNNTVLSQNQSFTFNFDSVYNESHKQEKFYASSVRPIVKSFVEGESGCVLLFGPTEGGKTYTLKGKTGLERGILPRAVEDMFNIVRNSEEREEDFEMVTPEITDTESDIIPSQEMYRGTSYYPNTTNPRDQLRKERVPERMFLKVCVYQIYVDRVIDLLGNTTQKQRVQIDHYLDKGTDEVVSRLANITEKVVFTIEDFYSVLQEAFKNRRIESVSMQENELRKKSHFIIGLTLMKRGTNKKMTEISNLNFVELAGSEQAVAEEKFYKDVSVKNFVTKSFNSLSSQLLKAALKKKAHAQEDGDAKILSCLRNTLTMQSNILLVCCVNPGEAHFEHSLPALKFCARIRDYVQRKLGRQGHHQRSQAGSSMDQIDYNLDSERDRVPTQGERQITRDLIDHIRSEVSQRALALSNGEYMERNELERWRVDKLELIERHLQRLRNQAYQSHGVGEKEYSQMIEDLYYIKDRIQAIQQSQGRSFSPLGQTQRSQTYNPYSTQSHHQASLDVHLPNSQSYEPSYRHESTERQYPSQNQYSNQLTSTQRQSTGRLDAFELGSQDHPQTPQFDYGSGSLVNLNKSNSRKQLQPQIRSQGVLSPTSVNNRTGNNTTQFKQSGFKPQSSHYQTFQKDGKSYDIETSLDPVHMFQPNQSVSRNQNNTIKVFNTQDDPINHTISPKTNLHDSKNFSKQLSRFNQTASNIMVAENEFLNRVHPQLDVSLTGEPNNIASAIPSRSPSPQKQVMFRPTNQSSRQQNYSKGNVGQTGKSSGNMSQISQKTNEKLIELQNRSQRSGNAKQSLLNVSNRIVQMQNESVYENEVDCMNDINRLIKINDFEGVKKRILEIYKEKNEQDKVLKEIDGDLNNLRDEIETKDQLIQEYEKVVRATSEEHQEVVENLMTENQDKEQKLNLKEATMKKTIQAFQEKLKEVEDERDKLAKEHELMSIENKTFERVKSEAEKQLSKVEDENNKLKQNYEILKEHEISLIRDFEGKKNKEVGFFDEQIIRLKEQLKEEQGKSKEYENQIFALREDFRRADFENEKHTEDRKHMAQQIEKLGEQLEREEEEKKELLNQIEESEKTYRDLEEQRSRVEDERNKAFGEIEKLHALIEEMEKSITKEQQRRDQEKEEKEEKIEELEKLNSLHKAALIDMEQKEAEMQQMTEREENLLKQIRELSEKSEAQEKQLIMIKAKEYDKVDLMKKAAELEAKLKYMQVDNETLVKERNNLDIANVELNREKVDLEQHVINLENELDFFKNAHEEHLDKFDQKFEAITTELSKLKNENISLKEKEKNLRRANREVEEDRDEWREKTRINERKCQDLAERLQEMEREVLGLMQEREKEMRDMALRQNMEVKLKDEEKGKMLDDIHHLIRNFKEEKKSQKTHIPAIHSIQHTSGYY